jgi:hypothetical protein
MKTTDAVDHNNTTLKQTKSLLQQEPEALRLKMEAKEASEKADC